ncbi:xanthine dehydrogenase small subunit [Spirosoma flavus]
MTTFILNNKQISTALLPGTTLLDFVRYHQHLTGTKIGCREGDCGACTVMVGELREDSVRYRTATSCLMPLGNAQGKHIVTIEGVNLDVLNPVQQAMADESATQCGFCTPGFVMSLAGFCLSDKKPTRQNAIAAIDGNICRCTGYKSIERAAERVAHLLEGRNDDKPSQFAVEQAILPAYFASIPEHLRTLSLRMNGEHTNGALSVQYVGGGTDVYVQKHDEIKDAAIQFLADKSSLKSVRQEGSECVIQAASTVTDLIESPVIQAHFPYFNTYTKLVSSTPIRNMATIGGNFVNASPIGDFTIFFLALDATLVLNDGNQTREVLLRRFYKGYKTLDKQPNELVEQIRFTLPGPNSRFNFEKVSKRTHLDIASVNSAIQITLEADVITDVCLSAGGVAPIPKRLEKTEEFLMGKVLSEAVVIDAINVVQSEISPISDARGTEAYKRLLLSQLIKAHFLKLFPELSIEQLITPSLL